MEVFLVFVVLAIVAWAIVGRRSRNPSASDLLSRTGAVRSEPQQGPAEVPESEIVERPAEAVAGGAQSRALATPESLDAPRHTTVAEEQKPARASQLALWDTQFENSGPGDQRPLDVVMGVDFGTSCSKVMIQAGTLGRVFAVPFESLAHETSEYLLPTILYRDESGEASLEPTGAPVGDLKLPLMTGERDLGALARCSVYLAATIRQARSWFLRTQHRETGARNLRWAMNLGVPSAGYDDKVARANFGVVARTAWRLSLHKGPLAFVLAEEFVDETLAASSGSEPVELVPEVAAEVVGYARSDTRKKGLHVMFDVGALTLDVCGFILNESAGEDQYNLLTAIVDSERGVHCLHESRLRALDRAGIPPLTDLDFEDPLHAIPEAIEDYTETNPLPDVIREAENDFKQKSVECLTATLMALRRARDPNSQAFRDGLRIFLCGGGCEMNFYQSVLDRANEQFTRSTTAAKLRPVRLEVPEGLVDRGVDQATFARLAVAYGLSFDAFDIGSIRAPKDIRDVPPLPRRREEEYLDN